MRMERLATFEVSGNMARLTISMACEINSSEPRRERERKRVTEEREKLIRERYIDMCRGERGK